MKLRGFLQNIESGDGQWVTFPVTKEQFAKEMEKAGIPEGQDFIWAGFESEAGDLELSQYESVKRLNRIAKALEKIDTTDADLVEAAVRYSDGDVEVALSNVLDGGVFPVDAYSDEELGEYIVEEIYGGVENLPRDTLEMYFDHEGLGRDALINRDTFVEVKDKILDIGGFDWKADLSQFDD